MEVNPKCLTQRFWNEKKAIVAELTEKLQNAAAGVLVDYKGITVAEDTALRNELPRETTWSTPSSRTP